MKFGYSPVSIFAQLCGSTAAAAVASFSPATAGAAAGVGSFVNAIFGGIEIKGEGNNIRADLTYAMDAAWRTIQKKYDLTEGCMAELKMEIMGERTSVAEFVRNSQSVGLKYAVANVIESILQRHTDDLNKNTRYVWRKSFTNKASSEIAAILIGSIEDVFENNDSLRILKAIADIDAKRSEEYRGISGQLDEINNKVDQFFDMKTIGSVSAVKARRALPTIKEKILPPCEPFIEGIHRVEDITNIHALLTLTSKPLWLYGERGIGKTELIRKFASEHSEYEYIFTTFSGSINQTISQNLFFFSEYELNGMELKDIVRYQKNMAAFSEYSRRLKEEQRNLILIVDNYKPINYEKDCSEETGLDIQSGISGVKNDAKEIKELLKTGVKVILLVSEKPQDSDVYAAYEIRGLSEEDHFAVMTGCFTNILPYIAEEEIREGLLHLIRIAGKRTVFITVMAFAMQNSKLGPKEALNKMMETFDVGEAYNFRYSSDNLKMHDHLERILRFINLSYQEKQMLAILAMLPVQGMRLDFFRTLRASNSVQVDKIRQAALQKLIDTNIIVEEYQQNELEVSEGDTKIICMSPLVADHALRVLAGRETGTVLNSIRMNWVTRLLHYIEEDDLRSLKKEDRKFRQIPMLTEACSAAEMKLKDMGERFQCEEEVAVSRRDLLMKASELSNKIGYVKDALEYVERAIAVEGPYAEDMVNLFNTINSVGDLFSSGGKYNRAKKCFSNCLKILDDKNSIIPDEAAKDFDTYDIEAIIQMDDGTRYARIFLDMAGVYEEQGDYEKALEYSGKALAIYEQVFGTEHPDTANTYSDIASVYRLQGDYEKALEYSGKALAIRERVYGTEHTITASSYNNMANILADQGDYRRALEYYGKTLAIREHVYETEHPVMATTYNNIGTVYRDMKNYGEALGYFMKATSIREKVLGEEHKETAWSYYNLGQIFSEQGDCGLAIDYYQRALKVYLDTFGEEHPRTKTIQKDLAKLRDRMSR